MRNTSLASAKGVARHGQTRMLHDVKDSKMADFPYVECYFLVPIVRDANLADGEPHTTESWEWLTDELWDRFGGATVAPGFYEGFYRDPDTGERVADKSRKYIVAMSEDKVPQLKRLLAEVCDVFCQKCIYLNIAGRVEFIEADSTAQGDS